MDYATAVATAPNGWRHFKIADVDRLPLAPKRRALARIPTREMEDAESGDAEAQARVVRSLFWTFVYHLEPARWDALACAEPIHPEILRLLPSGARTAIDLGAGSGRLTRHLAEQAADVVAVEPSLPLAALIRGLVPTAFTVAAWAERLPIPSGWSELTAACAAFGPDRDVLSEMARVTRPGGVMAVISPEEPERFVAMGWELFSFEPVAAPAHDAWIDDFFGPLDPPHELVTRRR